MTSARTVASIDIGTNSLLMTLVRPTNKGFLILEERCVVTRLGEGLSQTGMLSSQAVERTLAVLEEFELALNALGTRARAVGTSALRRANNSDYFLEKSFEILGFPVEILSGTDEARLSYQGAMSELVGINVSQNPIVIDPGGGSTEVHLNSQTSMSLELGAVRLTESFLQSDPPLEAEVHALISYVRSVLPKVENNKGQPVVAVGGTATTLAALAERLEHYESKIVHGRIVTLEEIRGLRQKLAALSCIEREKIPCLSPGRADISVAGALLLEELLIWLDVNQITVSDRGLRFGVLTELIENTKNTY